MVNWRKIILIIAELITVSALLFLLIVWMRATTKHVIENHKAPDAKEFRKSKYMDYKDVGMQFVVGDIIVSVFLCALSATALEVSGRERVERFIRNNFHKLTVLRCFGVIFTTVGDEFLVTGPFKTMSLLYTLYFVSRMIFISLYAPANVSTDFYRDIASKLVGLTVLNLVKEEVWEALASGVLFVVVVYVGHTDYYSLRYRNEMENVTGSPPLVVEHVIDIQQNQTLVDGSGSDEVYQDSMDHFEDDFKEALENFQDVEAEDG